MIPCTETLTVMSIIYPWADLHNLFHIDHIFPKAEFTKSKLQNKGITTDRISDFLENFNYIRNLQLLEGIDNSSKYNKDFKSWFENSYPTAEAQSTYKQKHLLPDNIDFDFINFPEFYEARKTLIVEKLKKELQG